MAKLYLDYVNIENSVIPSLNTAIKYLNEAIYQCNKMIVPNDFEYAQYLKSLGSKNYNTASSLASKQSTLQNSIKSYKDIEAKKADEFSEIPIFEISARKSMVSYKRIEGEKNE